MGRAFVDQENERHLEHNEVEVAVDLDESGLVEHVEEFQEGGKEDLGAASASQEEGEAAD